VPSLVDKVASLFREREGALDKIIDLVKYLVDREFKSTEGRINVAVLVIVFAVMIPGWLISYGQAVVRLFWPGYHGGAPSVTSSVVLFGGIGLACVLIVGLLGILRE
jgi:hypothetical protein